MPSTRVRTLGEFGVRLDAIGDGLDDAMRKALAEAGDMVAGETLSALRIGSGGDLVLSGVAGGSRIGVRVSQRGVGSVTVRATGPVALMDLPTRPHDIVRRPPGKALKTPYGYRRRVRHPGTRGKGLWTKTVDRVAADVPRVFAAALREHMQRRR